MEVGSEMMEVLSKLIYFLLINLNNLSFIYN